MLKQFNSYTVDIFINGPLIFLATVVDISSNGDEPLLNLTTLIFLWTRLDLITLSTEPQIPVQLKSVPVCLAMCFG